MTKLELKTRAWGKEYIKNNFNGTKTALKFGKKGMTPKTASVIATENLVKPSYQKGILQALEDVKLDDALVNRTTKRNLKQNKNLSASNTAIDIYHKLKGNYAPERKESINLNLTGEQLDKKIAEKIDELRRLNEHND